MINRFALSFVCIELDRDKICEVMLLYILLSSVLFSTHLILQIGTLSVLIRANHLKTRFCATKSRVAAIFTAALYRGVAYTD